MNFSTPFNYSLGGSFGGMGFNPSAGGITGINPSVGGMAGGLLGQGIGQTTPALSSFGKGSANPMAVMGIAQGLLADQPQQQQMQIPNLSLLSPQAGPNFMELLKGYYDKYGVIR